MLKQLICDMAIGLVVINSVSRPLTVLAYEGIGDNIVSDITIADWYNEDGELQYPITMDDERWPELYSMENKY